MVSLKRPSGQALHLRSILSWISDIRSCSKQVGPSRQLAHCRRHAFPAHGRLRVPWSRGQHSTAAGRCAPLRTVPKTVVDESQIPVKPTTRHQTISRDRQPAEMTDLCKRDMAEMIDTNIQAYGHREEAGSLPFTRAGMFPDLHPVASAAPVATCHVSTK